MKKSKLLNILLPTAITFSCLPLATVSCTNKDKTINTIVNCDSVGKEQYARLNEASSLTAYATYEGFKLEDGLDINNLVVDVKNADFSGVISTYVQPGNDNTFKLIVYFQSAEYLLLNRYTTFDLTFSHPSVKTPQEVKGFKANFEIYTVSIGAIWYGFDNAEYTIYTTKDNVDYVVPAYFTALTSEDEIITDFSNFYVEIIHTFEEPCDINAQIVYSTYETFGVSLNIANISPNTSGTIILRFKNKLMPNWYQDESFNLTISNKEADAISYSVQDGVATVKHCNSLEETVEIPETINKDGTDYDVTTLGANFLCLNPNVKHLKLSSKINNISTGNVGLFDIYSLETITIDPANQTFTSSAKVKGVDTECNCIMRIDSSNGEPTELIAGCGTTRFADSIKTIDRYAFNFCLNLKAIDLPDSVETISNLAFYNCYNLQKANLNKVKTIGARAFYYCEDLAELNLGTNLESIGTSAFEYNNTLKTISIPATTTNISTSAFVACVNLEDYVVADGNTTYTSKWNNQQCHCIIDINSKSIVHGCKKTIFPTDDTVTTIGANAFNGIRGLTTLNLPSNIETIDIGAFSLCVDLESIDVSNVASIRTGAFSSCTGLINVKLSDSLDKIESMCFDLCGNLKNINIPASCKTIGEASFFGCYNLENVTLPEGLTTIGSHAFYCCYKLKNISLPTTLTTIDTRCFEYCISLEEVDLSKTQILALPTYAFYNCWDLKKVLLPSTCTTLSDYAFWLCESLTDINLDNVTILGARCFGACTSLETVKLNDAITEIPTATFANCISLCNVTLPTSLTKIGSVAFTCCSSLETITIPSSVTLIRSNAFKYASLTNATFEDTTSTWTADGEELSKETVEDPAAMAEILLKGNIVKKTS